MIARKTSPSRSATLCSAARYLPQEGVAVIEPQRLRGVEYLVKLCVR
jgi:hypothetical protein